MRLRPAVEAVAARQPGVRPPGRATEGTEAFADLLGRLGARLGLEALTRLHPADSHIPEKGAIEMAAAFSAPADRLAAAGGAPARC